LHGGIGLTKGPGEGDPIELLGEPHRGTESATHAFQVGQDESGVERRELTPTRQNRSVERKWTQAFDDPTSIVDHT
jgi:hypothetical protein